MYVKNNEVLLEALTRNRRTRRPPGFDTKVALSKIEKRVTERIDRLASSLSTSNFPVSLFTVAETADMLGVSKRTVETLIAEGELVPVYIRSARRISKDQIEAYLRSASNRRN